MLEFALTRQKFTSPKATYQLAIASTRLVQDHVNKIQSYSEQHMKAVGIPVSPELVDDVGNRAIPSVDLIHPIDRKVNGKSSSDHLADLVPKYLPSCILLLPAASLLRCKL